MVASVGGETHRFRPLIDLYREAGKGGVHFSEQLKVGYILLGYVADTMEEAYQRLLIRDMPASLTQVGKEPWLGR